MEDKIREEINKLFWKLIETNAPDEDIVENIKKIFADEGYEPKPHYRVPGNITAMNDYGVKLYSGQEWFDRFEKELHITGLGEQAEQLMRSQVLNIAKKAAGLSND